MLGDELDIYDDLDDFQQVEEQKSKELQEAEQKYVDAQKEIAGLQSQNKALGKKIKTMEVNFQNLIDTAKAEIKRKDAMITQLRKEKDDICFRRKRPKWDETTPQQTPKSNSNQLALEKIENHEPAAKHFALSQPQSIDEQLMPRCKPALTETCARPPSRSPKRKEASKSQQHFSKNERHKNRDRDRSRERQRSRERSRNKKRKERDGSRHSSRHRSRETRKSKQRKQLNSSPDSASRPRQRSSKSSDSEHHARKSRERNQKPSTDVNSKKERMPNNELLDLVVGPAHSLIAPDTDSSNCNLNTKVLPMLENERQRSRESSRNKEPKERDGSRHNSRHRSREPRNNKQRKQLNNSPDSSRNSRRSASRSRQRSSKSSKHRKSREHYQKPSKDVNFKKESLPNNEVLDLLFGQTPVSSQIAPNSDSSNCNLNTKVLLENDVTSFTPSERITQRWQQQQQLTEQECGGTVEQVDTYFVSNTVESVMVSTSRVITIMEPIPGEVGSHFEVEQIDCLYQIPGLDLINGSTELQLAANYQPEDEKAYQVSAEKSNVHNIKSETKSIEHAKQVQENDLLKIDMENDSQKWQKELPNEIGLNDVDNIKGIINKTDDKNDKNAFETDKSNDSPKDQKSLANNSDIHDAATNEINIKQVIETDNDNDSQKDQKTFPTEIDLNGTEMVKGIGTNRIEIDKGNNSPKGQKVNVEYVKGVINPNEFNAKDVIETDKTTFGPKVNDIEADKNHKNPKHQKVDADNVKGFLKTTEFNAEDVIETDKTNIGPKVDDTDNAKGIVFGTEINIKDFIEIDNGNDPSGHNAPSNTFEQRLKKILNEILNTTETNVMKVNETNKGNNSSKLLQKDAENVKEIEIATELNGNDVIVRDKATLSPKATETDTFKGVVNSSNIMFQDDNETDKPTSSSKLQKDISNEIEMHEAEKDKGIVNVDGLNAKEQLFEISNSQNISTNKVTMHSAKNPSVEMVISTNCGESKPVEGIQIIEDIRLPPIKDIECIAMQVDVSRDKEPKDPVAKIITKAPTKKQGVKKCVDKKTVVPDNYSNVKKLKYEESHEKQKKLVTNIIVAQPDSTEAGPHVEDCDASLEAAMNELTREPDKSAQPLLEASNKSESKDVSLVQTLSPPDEATVTSTCTKVPKKIVPNYSQIETMPAAATPAKLKKKERSAEYAAELARHSPVKMRIKISTAKNALETTNELDFCEKTPLMKRTINLSDKQVEACVPATPATATSTSVLPAEEMNVTIDETAADRSISLELADDNAMSEYDNSGSANSIVTKRCSLGNSDYQYELVNNNVILRVKRRGNGSRKQRDGE